MLPTLLHARPGSPGHGVRRLGALDGIAFSNTYMLERCFGWRGLLIEGNPASFAKLRESGRAATFLHSAVCGAGDRRLSSSRWTAARSRARWGNSPAVTSKWGWWNRRRAWLTSRARR